MKKLTAFLMAALVAPIILAAIQPLPFYDPLNYVEGQLYTVGAGVWDAGGNSGNELTVSNAAALIAPTGLTNALGKGIRWNPSGTARRSLIQFPGVSSGTLYASFLINVLTPPSSGARLVAYFDSSTSQPASPQLGLFVGNGSFGIGKKSSTPGTSASFGSGTHFVVLRYTFTGTATDTVDFWVNPGSTTFGTVTPPLVSGSTSGGNNVASIPYFGLYAPSGTGPTIYFDEIRIGLDWASVTPPSGNVVEPPPSAARFTQSGVVNGAVILQGTNGPTHAPYEVLAATNPALPLVEWSVVGTNQFDGTGNFAYTNPATLAQRYYRLRYGGTNTTVAVAPTIDSQPQDQSAAIGQGALFSVTATGTPPLSYQWYFNTNTLLAAGTDSSLLISTVTSNDLGGYSVVVANSAGSITSRVAQLTLTTPPTDGDWFVSPTGNDANPGTMVAPFATLPKAISVMQPGQTVYLRGGTYFPSSTMRITNSGTTGNRNQILAYPGEKPYLNFQNQPYGANNRGLLFTTAAQYWNVKGLEIGYAGDNGIKVEGSYLRFEECVFHHCGDTGLQIGFGHTDPNPDGLLAAFVEVVNCDSYLNFDPDSNGGDADGFAAKMHCGQGIVFTGCRAWENSDDGWDLFETDYSVVISNCWTWKSGVAQGNGNGFKLGGNGTGGDSKGTHYAYHSVAFGHKVNGFTQNSHKDGNVLINCLSFANGNSGYNYFMEGSLNSGKQNIFRNNVSIPRTGVNGGGFIADNNPVEENNTWNLAVTANASDYVSLLEAAAKAPRNPDGSLPTGFARLVAGSDLIDKGVGVGIPFTGAAPDLGPFEWP
jgi:pectate disaccharide-lyase